MTKIARPGSEGNVRLLKQYGGGSEPPRQSYPKGYATGGAVRGDNPSLSEGLSASGSAAKPSLARSGRKAPKGKKEAKTNINVVVMTPEKGEKPPMAPADMPIAASPMPPPPMPMPPPGAGPGGPPMPMRAKGGRVVKDDEAQDKAMVKAAVGKHEAARHPGEPKTKLATGGPAKEPTTKGMLAEGGYQGGGGGAMGRLEKAKKYGK